jgi:hypothetical protein
MNSSLDTDQHFMTGFLIYADFALIRMRFLKQSQDLLCVHQNSLPTLCIDSVRFYVQSSHLAPQVVAIAAVRRQVPFSICAT